MRWTPDELAADAGGRLLQRGPRSIAAAFIDSRSPRIGGLFVPIIAARDGHAFIPDAIGNGAAAVLVATGRPAPKGAVTVVEVDDTLTALTRLAERRRQRFAGPVIGVTGSNGKTTTRAMLAAVARAGVGSVLCTRGNLNNHLGVPLTLLDEPHDPEAMVVELGMNAPGENERLASIVRPTVHVVTSVALEHLEFMGNIEAIAAAEAEPLRFVGRDGVVVVPSDEPLLQPHLPGPDGPRVIRFGPDDDADVQIEDVCVDAVTTTRIRVASGARVELSLRLFGAHNARNAAAALAVGEHLGYDLDAMTRALEQVEPVGDRSRVHRLGEHLVIADCYNANPGSVDVALRSLAQLRRSRRGPLLVVFGDMLELGPHERDLHEDVGRQVAGLGLDGIIGVGSVAAATIDAASKEGIDAHFAGADVEAAANWILHRLQSAEPGAVLVKASRGMKLERIVDRLLGR